MKVNSSEFKVTLERVYGGIEKDKSLANIEDIAFDKEYLEKYRYDWCWLGFQNIPQDTGWYKIDRGNKVLDKVTNEAAKNLQWHERLFIYQSAINAAKENSPLALYIGDECSDGRLCALYLCGPDCLTWVAQKQKN